MLRRVGTAAALPKPMKYRAISKSRCFTIFLHALVVTPGESGWTTEVIQLRGRSIRYGGSVQIAGTVAASPAAVGMALPPNRFRVGRLKSSNYVVA